MNTIDFFEAAKEYAHNNYPGEYTDKADGKVVHAFVDGAIYATIGAWKEIDFRPESPTLDLSALANDLPIILFNEDTMECVFTDTAQKMQGLLRSGKAFTHYMPTEYPFTVPLEEPEESSGEAESDNTENTNSKQPNDNMSERQNLSE